MTMPRYGAEMIYRTVEVLAEIQATDIQYQQRKATWLSLVLGIDVLLCEDCARPMLPRKLWYALELEDRVASVAPVGARGYCHYHYQKRNRAEHGLSEDQVAYLRRRHGVDKGKETQVAAHLINRRGPLTPAGADIVSAENTRRKQQQQQPQQDLIIAKQGGCD